MNHSNRRRPRAPRLSGRLRLTLGLWAPMLVWFAALRPGLMSADSLVIWEQATRGGWYDLQPPLYTAGMWVSTKLLGSPSGLTLAQSLLLAASMAAVVRALVRFGVPAPF